MITQRSKKYFRLLNLFGSVCSIPYYWNNDLNKVEYNPSYRKFIWYTNNVVNLSYLVFVYVRWIQQLLSGVNLTSPSVMGTLYIACSYSVVLVVQNGIWKNYGLHHIWINSFLDLTAEFQDTDHKDKTSMNRKQDPDAWLGFPKKLFFCFPIVMALDSLSVIGAPDEPYFLTSLLSEPKSQPKIALLPILAIHIYIWVHQQSSAYFFVTFVLGHVSGMERALQNME
ncbi:unnamed protein product [Allacma fusca]|uniref:Uncharacterized protein n=1 Tax=Allacma fusca TaxID=39272 RepID=A0A8J2KBQ4_9HEXA|nr:unnamed protein product [Allacma fusca]